LSKYATTYILLHVDTDFDMRLLNTVNIWFNEWFY
jgi:hypothetical protein